MLGGKTIVVDLVWVYGSGCAGVGAREGETVEMICNLLITIPLYHEPPIYC